MPTRLRRALLVLASMVVAAAPARSRAQVARGGVDTVAGRFAIGGYVEAFYAWNFNEPSNGITNYRGFDDRHNTFTLANAALDGQWEKGPISGRVTLQIGHTPNTYYLAEPRSPGAAGAGGTDANTWKYLQQAYVSGKIPLGRGLTVQGGLFLSPIGHESMAVKDNWSWSRSNLFFGLPFYHTGLRATQKLTERIDVTVAAYNAWNSVVDNNAEKSVSAQITYTDADRLKLSVLYFSGVERPDDAPEGRPWRHLFDAWILGRPIERLWLGAHGDSGFEVNELGTSWWAAGALYAQLRTTSWLYLAARGDYFYEHAAERRGVSAGRIFWPGDWVASGTGTIDVQPVDNLMVRLEYRHDQAPVNMYFRGEVRGAGTDEEPFVPNARSQDTLTLGATTWF